MIYQKKKQFMKLLSLNEFINISKSSLSELIENLFSNSILEQEIIFDQTLVQIFDKIGNKNQIAEFLFKELKKNGNILDINGEIKNVEKVYPHPAKPDFLLIHFTKPNGSPAKSEMKVGKFITALVKEMKDRHLKPKPQDIEHFVKLVYVEASGDTSSLYEFRVVSGKDIPKYYNSNQSESLAGSLGGSCMNSTSYGAFIKFYEEIGPKKVEMLIRINPDTDKIVGRALIWHLDNKDKYLDRIYVNDNKDIPLFIEYAQKKAGVRDCYDEEGLSENETVTIKNWKDRMTMPYLDTFMSGVLDEDNSLILFRFDLDDLAPVLDDMNWIYKYNFQRPAGTYEKYKNETAEFSKQIKQLKDGLTLSKIQKRYSWLLEATIDDAILGEDKFGLVWYNGTWLNGTWEDGRWENGTWKSGIWKGGIWNGGTWKDGTWENGGWHRGEWWGGIWKGGTWNEGTWLNGTWEKGLWKDGIWEDGEWLKGDWKGGTWNGGTWLNGTWEKGLWKDGIWEDGEWLKGTWKGGTWLYGKWYKGDWEDGTWKDGIWMDGEWVDGYWINGKGKPDNA